MEMMVVFLALKHFLSDLRGHHVLVHTDNTLVVGYINHRGVAPVVAHTVQTGTPDPPFGSRKAAPYGNSLAGLLAGLLSSPFRTWDLEKMNMLCPVRCECPQLCCVEHRVTQEGVPRV